MIQQQQQQQENFNIVKMLLNIHQIETFMNHNAF